MQVNFDSNNNKANFGQYNGPTLKRVSSVFGADFCKKYKEMLPTLQELGKKADVYVKTLGYSGIEEFDGFAIKVTPVTKSSIKRFLHMYEGGRSNIARGKVVLADEVYYAPKKFNDLLLEKINNMIAAVKK